MEKTQRLTHGSTRTEALLDVSTCMWLGVLEKKCVSSVFGDGESTTGQNSVSRVLGIRQSTGNSASTFVTGQRNLIVWWLCESLHVKMGIRFLVSPCLPKTRHVCLFYWTWTVQIVTFFFWRISSLQKLITTGCIAYQNMFQDWAYSCFFHLKQQNSRTQRMQSFLVYLRDPLAVCFLPSSDGLFCPIPAKTHHSDYQSHACSLANRGSWNQQSHPISSETLSNPHRPWFGHRRHQTHLNHRGRLYKHRWFFRLIYTAQHNFS